MMIFVNAFTTAQTIPISAMQPFLVLLNPFAPHLSSELWEKLKLPGQITEQPWPGFDERFLVEDEVEIVIQVNGKVRDRMKMSIQASEEEIKNAALALPKIRELAAGKQIHKVVVIPKKLVNIVL
jgi:leucyl-tRNA synthetase